MQFQGDRHDDMCPIRQYKEDRNARMQIHEDIYARREQHEEDHGFLPTWEVFTQALLDMFGPSSYDDLVEALTRLKKQYSMEEYKGRFEALSNRLRGISKHNKLSCFLSGLKDEIRLRVRIFNPTTLLAAYGLAKIED